mmetsp:Transcript_50394/g.118574  ORF Transcript_50394/g.118574 Transcript_50394/m.118574 type:complete len:393 (-) Transcript_50394:729-1907(-)
MSASKPSELMALPLRLSEEHSMRSACPSLASSKQPLSPSELSDTSSSPSPFPSSGINDRRPHGPIPFPRSNSPLRMVGRNDASPPSLSECRPASAVASANAPSCSSLLHERSRCVRPWLTRSPGARCWMPCCRSAFQSRSRCRSVSFLPSAEPSRRAPAGPMPLSPRSSESSEVLVKSARASCVAPSGASSLRRRLSSWSVEHSASAEARCAAPLHRIRLNPRSSVVSPPCVIATASASAAPDRIRFHDKLTLTREVGQVRAWATTMAPSVRRWLRVRLRDWRRWAPPPARARAMAVAPSEPSALSWSESESSAHSGEASSRATATAPSTPMRHARRFRCCSDDSDRGEPVRLSDKLNAPADRRQPLPPISNDSSMPTVTRPATRFARTRPT